MKKKNNKTFKLLGGISKKNMPPYRDNEIIGIKFSKNTEEELIKKQKEFIIQMCKEEIL